MIKLKNNPIVLAIIALSFLPLPAFAATFYASPAGSGSACSASAPCSLATGVSTMSGGDTLVLKDGTYSSGISGLKNGSAAAYTTIMAENDGAAVLTAPFNLSHTNAYLQFEGLKFNYAQDKAIVGNHLKFMRSAFVGGPSSGNNVNVLIGTSDYSDTQYILLEDCWAYGSGGRYKVLVYNADRVVLRRVVVRDDGGWTDTKGDPEGGVIIYQSSNVSVQNSIVIDSNLSSYSPTNVGAFYLTGHAGNRASSNAEYLGSMAINNKQWGWMVDTDDGATGLIMRDNVIYDQEMGGLAQSNTSVAMTIQRLTVGKTGYGIGNWGSKSDTVSDSLFFTLSSTSTGSNSFSYTDTYNPASLSGTGITHVNALSSGLMYLTRIEDGSALKSSGQAGGQMGAQIVRRYGVSGTLHGEAGYNALTSESLWPWPNEARIKSDFAGVSARGFATGYAKDGSPQTLTKYIWEYLGNPIPAEIYGGGSSAPAIDASAPVVAITAPSANATVSGTVSVTADASDNVGVSRVEFYVNGVLASSDTASPYLYSWNTGNVAGSYALQVKAYDAAGNVGQSSIVNVAVAGDVIAPSVSLSAPANNATLAGTVGVSASASDNIGVSKIEFYMDGNLLYAANVAPFSYNWNTTSVANGAHILTAKAYDAAGNVGQSSAVTVNVNNPVADTTAPSAAISAPANGASVSGTVAITASASDNVGVSKVEFYINNALQATDTAAPYSFSWNTLSVANGSYTLMAKAYDAAGNMGQSPALSVTVSNAVPDTTLPLVAITSPVNASSVSGTVAVSATASDNIGVAKVEFYVNGILQATDSSLPYSYSWNTSSVANGAYALMTKAYDAAGNAGQSAVVNVTVNNPVPDTTVPTAAIVSPVNNAIVSGSLTVTVSASDNVAIAKVEFYVNGALQATDTATPYTFSWNTAAVANGSYTLMAKAYDTAGNAAQSSPLTVSVNNAVQAAYSLWPASAKPAVVSDPDGAAVELGVKIRSDVPGYITGIRFYKSSSNTGTHVANLWSSNGTKLATATFRSETASGWQQVNFATPVAISANTVYVASYHTNTGHYSDDQNYFTGKGVDNGPLHALADNVSGRSGVYAYGSTSKFPTSGWNGSNYWVDVVFKK